MLLQGPYSANPAGQIQIPIWPEMQLSACEQVNAHRGKGHRNCAEATDGSLGRVRGGESFVEMCHTAPEKSAMSE